MTFLISKKKKKSYVFLFGGTPNSLCLHDYTEKTEICRTPLSKSSMYDGKMCFNQPSGEKVRSPEGTPKP